MKTPFVVMCRSAMAKQQKMSILINELVRRLSNTNFLNRDVAEMVLVIAQFIDIDINSKVYKLK